LTTRYIRRTSLGYTRESTYSIVKELRGRGRATDTIAFRAWWR